MHFALLLSTVHKYEIRQIKISDIERYDVQNRIK
jgi:hypothetical protein